MQSEMGRLLQGVNESIDRYCALDPPEGRPFAIAVWHVETLWPPQGERWITRADQYELKQWAGSLQANYKTDMAQAVESVASSKLKIDVEHLVIMCDGDINLNSETVRSFRERMPNCRSLSFVAFGRAANHQLMRQLATENNGMFCQF